MEKLNDFEYQDLRRNGKIIREIQFDRAADNALLGVKQFREEFFRTFPDSQEARIIFTQVTTYLDGLKGCNPWSKKPKARNNAKV